MIFFFDQISKQVKKSRKPKKCDKEVDAAESVTEGSSTSISPSFQALGIHI